MLVLGFLPLLGGGSLSMPGWVFAVFAWLIYWMAERE
jgi:hypothetical protein